MNDSYIIGKIFALASVESFFRKPIYLEAFVTSLQIIKNFSLCVGLFVTPHFVFADSPSAQTPTTSIAEELRRYGVNLAGVDQRLSLPENRNEKPKEATYEEVVPMIKEIAKDQTDDYCRIVEAKESTFLSEVQQSLIYQTGARSVNIRNVRRIKEPSVPFTTEVYLASGEPADFPIPPVGDTEKTRSVDVWGARYQTLTIDEVVRWVKEEALAQNLVKLERTRLYVSEAVDKKTGNRILLGIKHQVYRPDPKSKLLILDEKESLSCTTRSEYNLIFG